MGDLPPSGVGIVEEAVAVDDRVVRICKEGEAGNHTIVLGDTIHHALEIFRAIYRQGDNLGALFLLLRQQRFQLHELLGAVGSPVTPVED